MHFINCFFQARSHGLVVKADDQEVVGSNPGTLYPMDLSDLLAITFKKILKIKVAKWGKPKQILMNCFP
jgi:hypothetical protein